MELYSYAVTHIFMYKCMQVISTKLLQHNSMLLHPLSLDQISRELDCAQGSVSGDEMALAVEEVLEVFAKSMDEAYNGLQDVIKAQAEILNEAVAYDSRMKKAVRHIRQAWVD
jgi:hypothetical protein